MASTSTSGRGEEERDLFLALQPANKKTRSALTAKHFDVFINHRGPDTKENLAKPLYDSLQQAGIPAYLDFEETEVGDYFPSAIKNAIFSATLHIAILSPRYAESPWCLAELASMFQTRSRIIPLFYHADPSDFRHIKGGVADAFSKHEGKGRYPHHDIQQWKDCLQNVSGVMGYQLNGQNDDLNKLCKDIVSAAVKEKQKRTIPLQVAKHEVGLDGIAKDFHSHCERNGQMRDQIIGIYGMGGSGKTTLAKYLFNNKHSTFSGSTILFDVRENDVKRNLTSLQRKLLNDLKGERNEHVFCSTEDGIATIDDYLRNSQQLKFLIVIDDVDHQKQLEALLPIPADVLNPNSLVIITTRDERLLIKAGVRVRYKMKEMNAEHSRELFCCHAFRGLTCKIGFEDLVDSFVEVCAGLPLALRVIGGHVFGSDRGYWKLQLDVCKGRIHRDIRDTLKISYDSLEEDEKQVFMDIACFFIGEDVNMVMSVWKASGLRAEHALQTLKDKCLAEVETCFDVYPVCHYEPRYFLRMHDQLRDLGRAMADNETSLPRRLWRPEDHIDISAIKGFQDTRIESAGKSFRCYRSAREVERNHQLGILVGDIQFYEGYFLEISQKSTYAQSLVLNNYDSRIEWIPEWISLQNLHSVSLYNLSPARLLERDNQVPFKLKDLYCNIHWSFHVPDVNKDMFINGLVSSFGKFKHLESLRFTGSLHIEWNRLLKSVRELTNLQTLELRNVTVEGEISLSNREEKTVDRLCIRSLEAITLCCVSESRKLSIQGQFCPALKSLKLCSMHSLIEVDLTGVTTLECLVLLECEELREVHGNHMPKLERFHMRECRTIRMFQNFGRGGSLKRIYINHCQELQGISGIERLTGLKRIWIAHCPELKSIKAIEQLKELKRIWIQECPKLEDVICLKELKELKRLFIGGCTRLQGIQGMECLIRLEYIMITACPKLQNISGIEELEGLKHRIIAVGPASSCVQRLQRMASECTTLVGRMASDWHRHKWADLMADLYKICDVLPPVGDGDGDGDGEGEDVGALLGEKMKEKDEDESEKEDEGALLEEEMKEMREDEGAFL